MHQEWEDLRKLFFEGDPNNTKIILTLVSCSDAIVQGIRTIGIEPKVMMSLKEACFDQLSRYSNKDDCFLAAEAILQANDSKAFSGKVEMNQR